MDLKKPFIIGLLAIAGLTTTATIAKPHKGDIEIYRMMLSDKGTQRLELTTTQVEQIQKIYDSEKEAMKALREKNKQNRDTMRSLMLAEVFDKEAYLAALNEGQSERAELAVLRASNRHQIRNLLTFEQHKKLNKIKHKRRNREHS